jgi:hypothetical protein
MKKNKGKKRAAPRAKKALKRGKPARRSAARSKRSTTSRRPARKAPVLPPIEGYVNNLPPPVKPIVNLVRRIVREAAPEARELLHDNSPAYTANGLFARIEARDREVLLSFFEGASLAAPPGVLHDGEGSERHLSISSLDDVRENVLKTLVRQAVILNLSSRPPL